MTDGIATILRRHKSNGLHDFPYTISVFSRIAAAGRDDPLPYYPRYGQNCPVLEEDKKRKKKLFATNNNNIKQEKTQY